MASNQQSQTRRIDGSQVNCKSLRTGGKNVSLAKKRIAYKRTARTRTQRSPTT
jgi:hypothetical protein